MNKNNLEFSVACVDQNNSKSLIVFEINQVTSRVQKTNVGQFIKSRPFELNFPTSIGKSEWTVILFLNGQYENGEPNNLIYVYLKMLHCEHQSAEFKFDVNFRLGSEYYGTITKKDQRLCFDSVKTRWIGTKLMNINDMIIDANRFIQDDTLMLSVHLDELITKHVSSTETAYDNNYLIERESYAQADAKNVDLHENCTKHLSSAEDSKKNHFLNLIGLYGKTGLPESSGPACHNRYSSPNASVDESYRSNSPHSSDNATGSTNVYGVPNNRSSSGTNVSVLPSNRFPIYDSNLNSVEKEYSDDEDATTEATKSKNFIRHAFNKFLGGWYICRIFRKCRV